MGDSGILNGRESEISTHCYGNASKNRRIKEVSNWDPLTTVLVLSLAVCVNICGRVIILALDFLARMVHER